MGTVVANHVEVVLAGAFHSQAQPFRQLQALACGASIRSFARLQPCKAKKGVIGAIRETSMRGMRPLAELLALWSHNGHKMAAAAQLAHVAKLASGLVQGPRPRAATPAKLAKWHNWRKWQPASCMSPALCFHDWHKLAHIG